MGKALAVQQRSAELGAEAGPVLEPVLAVHQRRVAVHENAAVAAHQGDRAGLAHLVGAHGLGQLIHRQAQARNALPALARIEADIDEQHIGAGADVLVDLQHLRLVAGQQLVEPLVTLALGRQLAHRPLLAEILARGARHPEHR
jgi:hypothetical protein